VFASKMKKMLLTSVSSVWSRGGFVLNRTDSGFGGLSGRDPAVAGFPPHTQTINQHSASLHVD
jgi:hypothetical protein